MVRLWCVMQFGETTFLIEIVEGGSRERERNPISQSESSKLSSYLSSIDSCFRINWGGKLVLLQTTAAAATKAKLGRRKDDLLSSLLASICCPDTSAMIDTKKPFIPRKTMGFSKSLLLTTSYHCARKETNLSLSSPFFPPFSVGWINLSPPDLGKRPRT